MMYKVRLHLMFSRRNCPRDTVPISVFRGLRNLRKKHYNPLVTNGAQNIPSVVSVSI